MEHEDLLQELNIDSTLTHLISPAWTLILYSNLH